MPRLLVATANLLRYDGNSRAEIADEETEICYIQRDPIRISSNALYCLIAFDFLALGSEDIAFH
jgi:hypothetical protein